VDKRIHVYLTRAGSSLENSIFRISECLPWELRLKFAPVWEHGGGDARFVQGWDGGSGLR